MPVWYVSYAVRKKGRVNDLGGGGQLVEAPDEDEARRRITNYALGGLTTDVERRKCTVEIKSMKPDARTEGTINRYLDEHGEYNGPKYEKEPRRYRLDLGWFSVEEMDRIATHLAETMNALNDPATVRARQRVQSIADSHRKS